MAEQKLFKIVDGPLSVRNAPGGERINQIAIGEQLEVDANSRTESGGFVWWRHNAGWSAERSLDGAMTFLQAITGAISADTDKSMSDKKIFKADGQDVRIRNLPSLRGTDTLGWIKNGDTVEVDTASRTEADSYVWWQHSAGWSAERKVDGSTVFLTEVQKTIAPKTDETTTEAATTDKTAASSTDDALIAATRDVGQTAGTSSGTTSPPAVDPAAETKETKVIVGKKRLQANTGVKVRDAPGGTEIATAFLAAGSVIEYDASTTTEAKGYIWVQHQTGWSALRSTDGSTVFFVEPGSVQGLVAIGPDGPDPSSLPGYRTLITRLPVALSDCQWWQYFGNNVFGFTKGKDYGYDGYSQGLHGGLDLGNSSRSGIPIYAGLEADVIDVRKTSPNLQIWAKNGDYTIIWQHIINPTVSPGQRLTPDTQIAQIEHSSQGGWDHLHFEIRYVGKWIVNPLLLMPDDMVNQITAKFNPASPGTTGMLKYFYKSDKWNQWVTPLDQPMIKLAGPVIGPKTV